MIVQATYITDRDWLGRDMMIQVASLDLLRLIETVTIEDAKLNV